MRRIEELIKELPVPEKGFGYIFYGNEKGDMDVFYKPESFVVGSPQGYDIVAEVYVDEEIDEEAWRAYLRKSLELQGLL